MTEDGAKNHDKAYYRVVYPSPGTVPHFYNLSFH